MYEGPTIYETNITNYYLIGGIAIGIIIVVFLMLGIGIGITGSAISMKKYLDV